MKITLLLLSAFFYADVSYASNVAWMGQDLPYIGNKKLAEIAIPGTHDSGTLNINSASGKNNAKTQSKSLIEQLEAGVRYFDIRFYNNRDSGKDCPIPSDYYIYHNSDLNWIDQYVSYRLNEAMDQIVSFVKRPENKHEVLILDIQKIETGSTGSDAVLLSLIQKYLDGHIIKNIPSQYWWKLTFNELINLDTGKKNSAKVILLVSNGDFAKDASNNPVEVPKGCGVSMNPELWHTNRWQIVNGLYNERRTYSTGLDSDIFSQLGQNYAISHNMTNAFDKYRKWQEWGYINVLNFAPRPGNNWYFSAHRFLAQNRIPDNLIEYSKKLVNIPFNRSTNIEELNPLAGKLYRVSSYNCWTGMIGKYSWMGASATQDGSSGMFNKPNVLMIDSFDQNHIWVNAEYNTSRKRWEMDGFRKDFVSFVRRLNKTGYHNDVNVPSMDDEACIAQ